MVMQHEAYQSVLGHKYRQTDKSKSIMYFVCYCSLHYVVNQRNDRDGWDYRFLLSSLRCCALGLQMERESLLISNSSASSLSSSMK